MAISGLTYLTPGATAIVVTPGPVGNNGPQGQQGIVGPIGPIGPIGATPLLGIGVVTPLATGQPATASIDSTSATNPKLNLGLPAGPTGPANALTIRNVVTLASGASATATIAGTAPSQTLDLGIPQGPPGATGNGTGNVLGPAGGSATNHIALFSDSTGTAIKDGGALGGAATLNVGTATGTVPDAGGVEYISRKGQPSGYAALDSTGKVPAAQMGAAFPVSAVAAKSAAYTILAADRGVLFDLTGSFTLTLPAASSASASSPLYYHFRKRDGSGACQIACAGSDTFASGRTSLGLYQEDATFVSFGGPWYAPPGGRQRGWVAIGTTTLSATVASVSFTTGFGDTELRDMAFDYNNVTLTGGSAVGLLAQVTKAGSLQSSNYTSMFITYGPGGASGGLGSISAPGWQLDSVNSFNARGGDLTIFGFGASGVQRCVFHGSPQATNAGGNSGEGFSPAVSGGIQGLTILPNGAFSLTAGVFNQKAYRP